jgi:hypothetical protein
MPRYRAVPRPILAYIDLAKLARDFFPQFDADRLITLNVDHPT